MLRFRVDWEHRFEAGAPVYMQIARGDLVLHLSAHHGDGCPGGAVYVRTTHYRFMRPGIERSPWGSQLMEVVDPFANRLRFDEALARPP